MNISDENYNDTKVQSKIIREYINNEKYNEAEKLAKMYPDCDLIQSQLITVYMMQKRYKKAEKIAKQFLNDEIIQSQLITIYMKQEKYDEAEELIKKYQLGEIKQSQLITIYMKQEKYDEAEEFIKNHPDNEHLQSQLVTIYIGQHRYDEAEELIKNYPDNEHLQSQLITIYIKQEKYKKAEALAKKYSNNEPIQNQLISIYMKKARYKEALEIARKYPDNYLIQSQLMSIYMKIHQDNEAEKIALKYSNDEAIQSKLITIYIRHEKYKEAEEIALKYQKSIVVQSQLITIYIKQQRYDEAEALAKKNINYERFQSQLVTIYMKQERYNDALEIAREYPDNELIQIQTAKIKKICDNIEVKLKLEEFPDEIKNIRTKLSLDKISYSDLDILSNIKEKIDPQKIELIKLAIYDRLGYKKQTIIKSIKSSTVLDSILKKELISYIENKKSFFDLGKWDDLIGWDSNIDEYHENVASLKKDNCSNNSSPDISTIQQTNKKKLDKVLDAKPVELSMKKINKVSTSPTLLNKSHHKNKKISSPKKNTVYDILNDGYKEKVFELKLNYYIDMESTEKRKSAIYKYDRLEDILVSEPSQNNLELLLLMLVGDMNLNIEKEYPKEYSKILQKINIKKSQYQSKKDN